MSTKNEEPSDQQDDYFLQIWFVNVEESFIIYIMIAKLYQWLIAGSIFLSIWLGLLLDYVQSDIISQNKYTIFMFPIYLAVAFAVYSVAIVGYRVATFNDCDEAAVELQQQIKEAREDLKSKGFVFTES